MSSHKHQPWVSVAVFEKINDGRILETFFRDRDIDSRTYDDKLLQLFLFLCPPRVTFRVQVRQDQFDAATHAMDDAHPAILELAIHCPECGSLRVNYPQMTRRFFLPTLLLHSGIIFRVIGHECYCENCHLTWNLAQDAPRKIRSPRPFFPFKQ
ncbi:MAG: hypothetical protein ACRED1_03250 [Limisphaerales bacterium]